MKLSEASEALQRIGLSRYCTARGSTTSSWRQCVAGWRPDLRRTSIDEPRAHGPRGRSSSAAARGPTTRGSSSWTATRSSVPHSRWEVDSRRGRDGPVDEQPGLRQGPSRVLREVVGLRNCGQASARGAPRTIVLSNARTTSVWEKEYRPHGLCGRL